MGTLAQVFPVLAGLKKSDDEKVGLVNEGIVEEVLLELGSVGLRQRDRGQLRHVALWRTRGEHMPLVGEFAYQAKFDRKEDVAEKAEEAGRRSSTSRCSRTCRTGWHWA